MVTGSVAREPVEGSDLGGVVHRKFLGLYEEPWGRRIRTSLKAMRMFEKLSDEDLNELATVLDENDVLDLANGLDVKRVGLKLLKHPRLAGKIALSLINL